MQKYGEKGAGCLSVEFPVLICWVGGVGWGRDSSGEKICYPCRPATKLTDLSILAIIIMIIIINHNP